MPKANPYVTLARQNGLTKSMWWNRVRHGWSKHDAATAPRGVTKYTRRREANPVREINRLIALIGTRT
jgi:hypothetical protein